MNKIKKQPVIPRFILFLILVLLAIMIVSSMASVLFPIDLGQTSLTERLLKPAFMEGGNPGHLLGTDHLGRDFAIRLVYGTRNTLMIAGTGLLIAMTVGTALGVAAGMNKGFLDSFIMFLVDVRLSVPSTIIGIVCASIFGSGKMTIVLIIGFTGFASFARLVRGQILQLRESNFIECSQALGASKVRILFEHVLINIASPLIINGTMRLSSFILLESSLSFLGLGIQPPDVSLGVMVSAGRDYLINAWWLTIVPSMIIVVIVLSVSLIGDWLRDKLDPKLQTNS
ncbi:MAG: ABC transporter permease [Hungatella sp.]|nr:ABC transporter permease [Hungatella sp.]